MIILFFFLLLFVCSRYIHTKASDDIKHGFAIQISSNEEFPLFSKAGKGTKENPYVISEYFIEHFEAGIFISQTTKFFIITNCTFLNLKYEAIRIMTVDVGNVRIENNTIINTKFGIYIYQAPKSIIVNNKIVNCTVSGIRDEFSGIGSKIENNTLYNNEEAITIYSTNYTQILNNYIIKSRKADIFLLWKPNETEIHYNFVLNSVKPYTATAHDEGFYNNWTSNYWNDWNGTGDYQISSLYGPTFDTNPLSFNDTDGDKIIDILEIVMNTDPYVVDSDNDGINDYNELLVYATNPNVQDSDGDGISDYEEIMIYETNPNTQDTDNDGITDYDELFVYGTDAKNKDTDEDTFSDYEEIMQKTNPRKSYSNPITKKYITIFIPTFSGILVLAAFSTRYYSNSKKNKIKVIFDTWNEFFNEWEKIIEQINNTKRSEVEEIIFEVKELKNKKIDELEIVKKIISQAKKLLINHMKFNVELSLQKYKKQAEIVINLQNKLINQALSALNQITKNIILNAVKDYLWMRFVYLYSTTNKSETITTIEDISGDALFNKFIKFYKSLDYEERLKEEVAKLAEEITYQIRKTKDYEIDLLESSINSIIDSLLDKFNKLEVDINFLEEKINDISIKQTKLDDPKDSFLKIENIVKEEVKEQKSK